MGILEFFGAMLGTRAIEIAAALLGFVNVVLIIRRSVWNYPFGIAMVILYAWIFFEAKLYSDALLQIFFLVIQVFGVFWWLRGRDREGLVVARDLPPASAAVAGIVALAGACALGYAMSTWTDAVLPWWDAATTVLSVTAQVLMARRYVQSWLVWIVVDILSIGIYLSRDLTPTAVLYLVFLCLAAAGWIRWRSSMTLGAAVPA